jgi:phosphohistidine phosphatase
LRTLHLLRHAKSDWDDPDLPDRERPLNGRGRRDSKSLRKHLEKHPLRLDAVFFSTALRARRTLEAIAPALGGAKLVEEPALYGAGADELLDFVRGIGTGLETVMLVGHNPGFEELTRALLPAGKAPAAFPTCTLATLGFEAARWSAVGPGAGRLAAFLTPAGFA